MIQEFTTEELQSEEWRDVVGQESLYSVSNLGRVKSKGGKWRQAGRILKPSLRDGYPQVVLGLRPTAITRRIHQLVAAAFIGPCPTGSEPNHIDRCRTNNRVDNLEYLTQHENILHSIVNETHHLATLGPDDARLIRRLDRDGMSPGEICARFPLVDRKSVYNVRTGRTWKYLTD